MANLNGDIKKLLKGERLGTAATVFCAVVLIYFAVCFPLSRVYGLQTLQLVTLITAPVLMIAGVSAAAYCNLKFGGAVDRAVREYVTKTCVENAALFHPERNSLTFYLCAEESEVSLQVNGYKEKIVFDFSFLGKLSPIRTASVLGEIENRLTITFCRLYERGASYSDVSYSERAGTRRKSGKAFFIINEGIPDKKAYKYYLKNK